MHCPIDGTRLVMTDRAGVEIDYCPQCRGVWLDRGELDKIVERGAAQSRPQPRERDSHRDDDRDHQHGYDQGRPHTRCRESFLSDLFDF